jgi:hypothetical protein
MWWMRDRVHRERLPAYRRAFPNWFAWSPAAPAVRAAQAAGNGEAV